VAAAVTLAADPGLAQGSVALIGGGTESSEPGSWSEAPYRWIVERASFGSIVVLSEGSTSRWLPDYFEQLGASSAFNLQVPDRITADAASTATAIADADGVFIKGGNQWLYVSQWRETRTAEAIRQVLAEGGVVAGTSAGAMVLSDVVFDARNGTVYPEETLADPYVRYVSFTSELLDLVPGTLVDTHFTERGRLARLVPMVARWQQDHGGPPLIGLGIDTQTALLVEPDGRATVAGEGSVTVARTTQATRQLLVEGQPPVVTHVACDLLLEGFEVDLMTGQVTRVPPDAEIVTAAARSQHGWPALTLDGADPAASSTGEVRLGNVGGDPLALQAGALTLVPGDGLLPDTIVMTAPFDDPALAENKVGGLLWGLSERPGFLGLLLVSGSSVEVRSDGGLRPGGEVASVLIDAANVTVRDRSRWVVLDDSAGPRQSVAVLGLVLHVLPDGWLLLGPSGTVHERIDVGRSPVTRPVSAGELGADAPR
jgi:cyanophycinase